MGTNRLTRFHPSASSDPIGAFTSTLVHATMPRNFWRLSFWSLLALVTTASLMPTEQLPPQVFNIWDKAQHAAGFLALTGFGLLAYGMPTWRWAMVMGVYGAGIEIAQAASGWRTGDVLDWLADMSGVALALLAHTALFRRHQPVRR